MLSVSTQYIGGILFVRLKGELTLDTTYKLDKKVTKKITDDNINNLVFNLKNLKLIDYRGINKLLYNYEIVKKIGGNILLCGNNININNVLKKSHLLNYINEIKDELCAVEILNKG